MPRLEKYIKRELGLRISAIVLAAFCIIAAAVCINVRQKRESKGLPSPYIANLPWLVLKAYDYINIRAANGWLLSVSFVLIIFQIAAIVVLFVDIKVLRTKIPCGGSLWYLVTIIKLCANIFFIIGYLGALIPLTVFVGYYIHFFAEAVKAINAAGDGSIISDEIENQSIASTLFAMLFSFGAIIRCIVMLIFTLLAKFKYKCSNYDPSSDGSLDQAAITETDYASIQINNNQK